MKHLLLHRPLKSLLPAVECWVMTLHQRVEMALAQNRGCFIFNKMHDGLQWLQHFLIFLKTKNTLRQAKKRLFKILRQLRLTISPHKTRMGRLKTGFHFLGVDFAVSRNPQSESQVTTHLHSRSHRRALDKVEQLRGGGTPAKLASAQAPDSRDQPPCATASTTLSVHPALIQRYLVRWATWWHHVIDVQSLTLFAHWVAFSERHRPELRWLGSGLLMGCGRSFAPALRVTFNG